MFPARYWKSAANCRIFFNEYAKNNGFDPLIAANWYTVTSTDIQDTKVSFIRFVSFCFILFLLFIYIFVLFSNVVKGWQEDTALSRFQN